MKKQLKRALSLVLTLALLVGSISMLTVSTAAEEVASVNSVWDGTIAEEYAGGTGTAEDPYKIANGAQLAKLVTAPQSRAYYVLTDDIYLNDISDPYWMQNEPNVWITSQPALNVYFDGQGNTINGVYIPEESNVEFSGLFQQTWADSSNGVFTPGFYNTAMRHSYLYGEYAGFLAKYSGVSAQTGNTLNIKNCMIDETVTLVGTTSAGLVAWADRCNLNMSYCYSRAIITAPAGNGALVGKSYFAPTVQTKGISFIKCYAVVNDAAHSVISEEWGFLQCVATLNTVISNNFSGDVAAGLSGLTVTQTGCKEISLDLMKGRNPSVHANWPWWYEQLDSGLFSLTIGSYPELTMFCDEIGAKVLWSGRTPTSTTFAGTGTAADPYLVENAEQLRYVVTAGVDATNGKYYKLTNDLYLNDYTTGADWYKGSDVKTWVNTTNAAFQGNFDGDGHIVNGLCIYGSNTTTAPSAWEQGLFPVVGGGTNPDGFVAGIYNLGLRNAYMYSTYGGIVGKYTALDSTTHAQRKFEVKQCYMDDTVIANCSFPAMVSWTADHGLAMVDCFIDGTNFTSSTGSGDSKGTTIGSIRDGGTENLDTWTTIEHCIAICGPGMEFSSSTWTIGQTCNLWGNYGTNKRTDVTTDKWNQINIKTTDELKNITPSNLWSLTIGDYPVPTVFLDSLGLKPRWDGKTDSELSGSGTAADPYLVTTGAELRYIATAGSATAGKYYKLTDDIYLNDITKTDWLTNGSVKNWAFSYNIAFQGFLEGDGHIVYGLATFGSDLNTKPGSWEQGLFSSIKSPLIEGFTAGINAVGIKNAYVKANTAGALVGFYMNNGTNANQVVITNCFADETVTLDGDKTGLIASTQEAGLTVQYCYAIAKNFTSTYADGKGAIVGYIGGNAANATKTQIKNCYAITNEGYNFSSNTWPGQLIDSYQNYGTHTVVDTTAAYKVYVCNEASFAGVDAVYKMSNLHFGDKFIADTDYPKLLAFSDNAIAPETVVGDANNDGILDLKDIVRVKKVALGEGDAFAAIDLDSNLIVNALDVTAILRAFLAI